jgi:hypothetical protein
MSGTPDRARFSAELLARIRAEYLEMPGLRLTTEQMQRLCGVDRTICEDVLNALIEMKFLVRKPNGAHTRAADGADIPRPSAAKATLRSESTIRVSQGIAADGGRTR